MDCHPKKRLIKANSNASDKYTVDLAPSNSPKRKRDAKADSKKDARLSLKP